MCVKTEVAPSKPHQRTKERIESGRRREGEREGEREGGREGGMKGEREGGGLDGPAP